MERIAESAVAPEYAGLRLDVYLGKRFSYRSRNEWQKVIDNGEILVSGRPARASRKLGEGEIVAYRPKEELKEPEVNGNYTILEETKDYLAVDKPGNLPCHPAGVFFKNTLWYMLREKYGTNLHIATRLDRGTSGVVLIARNPETARCFTDALKDAHTVDKRYYAVVHGHFPDEIQADGWLSPDPSGTVSKKRRFTFEEVPGGESSSTFLKRVKTCSDFSLVEARPATGRLHQIRITLFSLGFPLAGDLLYGTDDRLYLKFIEDKLTDGDRRTLLLPRQALHAYFLAMPFRGKTLSFQSPMPEEMASILRNG